ncbi:glycine/betaine ABC transporter substrate-binding protein [Nocardioides psychrotolerans]|uniref:Osmoprotectant transport system substrate-binding protein n=1 Tax=Nocardioides psychrotolerans TaxID=1005945 RepID=A0A1I3MX79_9ACTN|nr:glycine betaine ABC transporter substrate-binding protein [Nocardioides psychrotolerans]GEP39050.1 glycine/betaine ABC transporter substrate-binding protein [Nocardioides psychrotolerans]SFJ01598.1 osmoprotectant transport system substrate-binding protein [Nocardioides psychrotolerans]
MMLRRPLAAALTLGVLSLATACAGDDLAEEETGGGAGSGGSTGGQVTLASQSFDEAALITAMYAALLEDTGYEVETRLVDTRGAYLGEFPGTVDIVPEYLAGLGDELNIEINGEGAAAVSTSDTQETIDAMAPLLEEKGIALLETSGASSQNAYFVTQEFSDAEGVTALSDLEGQAVTLAAAPDCKGRADCEAGLTEVYGMDVTLLPLGYASPQTYQSVIDGESQLGQTGTFDGSLEAQGLVLLEDDRGIQPAQNLVPAVTEEFLAEHPDVEDTLNGLMEVLDNDTLGALLLQVTVDRETVEDVAQQFLTDEGLL